MRGVYERGKRRHQFIRPGMWPVVAAIVADEAGRIRVAGLNTAAGGPRHRGGSIEGHAGRSRTPVRLR